MISWRFLWAYLIYTWGVLHRFYGNKNSVVSDYRAAVRYFGRALNVDPTFRLPRLHRGVLLWRELGDPAAALVDFDHLLERDPRDGAARFNKAMALQADGRYAPALAELNAYLRLPRDDQFWDLAIRNASLLRQLLAEEE